MKNYQCVFFFSIIFSWPVFALNKALFMWKAQGATLERKPSIVRALNIIDLVDAEPHEQRQKFYFLYIGLEKQSSKLPQSNDYTKNGIYFAGKSKNYGTFICIYLSVIWVGRVMRLQSGPAGCVLWRNSSTAEAPRVWPRSLTQTVRGPDIIGPGQSSHGKKRGPLISTIQRIFRFFLFWFFSKIYIDTRIQTETLHSLKRFCCFSGRFVLFPSLAFHTHVSSSRSRSIAFSVRSSERKSTSGSLNTKRFFVCTFRLLGIFLFLSFWSSSY